VIDVVVDNDLRLANGNTASVNLTVVPLIDTDNTNIGTMLILDDITHEKRIKTTMSRYMSKEVADQVLAAGDSLLGGKAVANQMLIALRALNERRDANGQLPIDIGIGIATGQVIVGSIGSPKRMEYTAIGDSVNLSSRLEGATKVYGVKILVSESTVRDLRKPVRLREIDLLRVKGKDQSVAVYEALDHFGAESFPAMDEVLEAYGCGLERYKQQGWHAAGRFFAAALARHPKDRPSQIYRDRCRQFEAVPPPADWNGVWVLADK
jgi:adenylate cyclase